MKLGFEELAQIGVSVGKTGLQCVVVSLYPFHRVLRSVVLRNLRQGYLH